MYKILLTQDKHLTLPMCPNALFDPETDLYYADMTLKSEVQRKLSY